MARVPEVTQREHLAPEHRHIWDAITGSRGAVSGPFRVLLHSPELAGRTAHLGAYVRFESALTPQVRALVALVTARHFDCQFEWTVNELQAREEGVRSEAILSIRDRTAPAGLEGDEELVFQVGQELLVQHRLSDATFGRAMDRFGLQALTDLVGTFGYYTHIAMALNAFQVDPAPHHPRLLPE